jgi:uncharacterized membrane protein
VNTKEIVEAQLTPGRPALAPLPEPKYQKPLLWGTIGAIALFVLLAVEVPLFSSSSPHRERLLTQIFILIPHAVSGSAAFLLGPVQFSTRLRRSNLRLHRILGKVYVISVFISVPSALLLGNALPKPLIIAADSQAVLWFICTLAAFVTARNRHIAQHRVWMIRSYSVTLVFFTSRVLIPIPAYGNMSPTGIATSLFILQLSALMVPEIALHWSALTTIPHAWGNRSSAPLRIAVLVFPGGIEAILELIVNANPADVPALAERFYVRIVGPAPF